MNLIEVEQSTLDNGEWAPLAGLSLIEATTDEGDKLNTGDTVHSGDRAADGLASRFGTRRFCQPPSILVYGDDEDAPQHQFNVGDTRKH